MVFTLHRYVLRDLLRHFTVATVVLSVVLGLGVMLRPLRDFSMDPVKVPMLIVYTLPITLTMVLPVAALLAATLVYGRLAADNEINACRASGISLGSLVYPAAAFALLVGMATLLLAFHAIPSVTGRFEKLIRTDAQAIIFRNIERNGNLGGLFGDLRVHADRADAAARRLDGVALLWLHRGQVEWAVTAERVLVDFEGAAAENQILLHLTNAHRVDETQSLSLGAQTLAIPLPSLWRDRVKFKKLGELKAIQRNPGLFGPVAQQVEEIRRQVLVERFFQWCDQRLAGGEELVLPSDSAVLRLKARGCQMQVPGRQDAQVRAERNRTGRLLPPEAGPLELELRSTGSPAPSPRLYRAEEGYFTVVGQTERTTAVLTLENLRWRYADETADHGLLRSDVARVPPPTPLVEQAQALAWNDLDGTASLEQATGLAHPSPYLRRLGENLLAEGQELATGIVLELHARLAFGVSCVVLVLLGAALGIVCRSSHLLAAFGVSFIPAALCLISIFTGKHIAEQSRAGVLGGIVFLWAGIALLAAANAAVYRRLLRQ